MVMYDLDRPEKLTKEIIPFDSWGHMFASPIIQPETNSYYCVVGDKEK